MESVLSSDKMVGREGGGGIVTSSFFSSHFPFGVGIGGVYKGLLPTVLKQGSNQAIRFFVYENMKHWFQGDDYSKNIGTLRTAFCGVTAGAASVFGNTPIDVIKTRMQVDTLSPSPLLSLSPHPSPPALSLSLSPPVA